MKRWISAEVTRREAPIWTHASSPDSNSRYSEEREIRRAAAASDTLRSNLSLIGRPVNGSAQTGAGNVCESCGPLMMDGVPLLQFTPPTAPRTNFAVSPVVNAWR